MSTDDPRDQIPGRPPIGKPVPADPAEHDQRGRAEEVPPAQEPPVETPDQAAAPRRT